MQSGGDVGGGTRYHLPPPLLPPPPPNWRWSAATNTHTQRAHTAHTHAQHWLSQAAAETHNKGLGRGGGSGGMEEEEVGWMAACQLLWHHPQMEMLPPAVLFLQPYAASSTLLPPDSSFILPTPHNFVSLLPLLFFSLWEIKHKSAKIFWDLVFGVYTSKSLSCNCHQNY